MAKWSCTLIHSTTPKGAVAEAVARDVLTTLGEEGDLVIVKEVVQVGPTRCSGTPNLRLLALRRPAENLCQRPSFNSSQSPLHAIAGVTTAAAEGSSVTGHQAERFNHE